MITETNQSISLGEACSLAVDREELVKDGLAMALSRTQFRLLYCLALRMGEPVATNQLIEFTWGNSSFVSKNELYVYINRLRNRIEDDPKQAKCLLSIRGLGYVLYPRQK